MGARADPGLPGALLDSSLDEQAVCVRNDFCAVQFLSFVQWRNEMWQLPNRTCLPYRGTDQNLFKCFYVCNNVVEILLRFTSLPS